MPGRLAALILRLIGWTSVYTPPPGPKAVVIVPPHTSNWDFPLGLLFRYQHGVFMHWASKVSFFHWPLRGLFLRLGGIPVNRRECAGMIDYGKSRLGVERWITLTGNEDADKAGLYPDKVDEIYFKPSERS